MAGPDHRCGSRCSARQVEATLAVALREEGIGAGYPNRTDDLLLTKQSLLPTELSRLITYSSIGLREIKSRVLLNSGVLPQTVNSSSSLG